MADISREIQAFEEARKGKEVRGSMVSLAQKVNMEVEMGTSDVADQVRIIQDTNTRVNRVAQDADATVVRANSTIARADEVLVEAMAQATNSAGSAKTSQSWAAGGTGTRSGENTNNSEYYSQQAESSAYRAENDADRAAQYSQIVAPGFYFDPTTSALYMKTGVGVDFIVEDARLYWKILS